MTEYPCGACQTEVVGNNNSIICDLCDKWHHTICVDANDGHYEKHKIDPNSWLFPTFPEEIPFFVLAKKDLKNLLSNIFLKKSVLEKVHQKTEIRLEKFKELSQLLNETENNISCNYFKIYEFRKIKIKQHVFFTE